MPPKKKSNSSSSSSSKKSTQQNPNSQPTKYGIQHFFERHSISASQKSNGAVSNPTSQKNPKSTDPDGIVLVPHNGNPKTTSLKIVENGSDSGGIGGVSGDGKGGAVQNGVKKGGVDGESVESAARNSGNGLNSAAVEEDNPVQNVQEENVLMGHTNGDCICEVSPEVSKYVPRKRFRFSPSMLIKQSQDDGVDEVTWKISPVNERLQAISKHIPDVVKSLAEASRLNASNFEQCCNNATPPSSEGELRKQPASVTFKEPKTFSALPSRPNFKRVTQDQDANVNGDDERATEMSSLTACSIQSPFRTPPSLPHHHDKESFGLRQHKKALLELLDQVKNVISVEEEAPIESEKSFSKAPVGISNEKQIRADSAATELATSPQEESTLAPCFLVLEVTEKRGVANSSGVRNSSKFLRVLNEQSGEEQSVHLRDDWFYSVIEPGDTIRIVGEFDDNGNCDVSHEKNLLIVHPDLLLSGTRVAASFSCPRRAVLDERFKSNEHSVAALVGTLLHQIFQAGILMEFPTRDILEEYSKIVLHKNIESLYACGVTERDVQETMTQAIPKILNWIDQFRGLKKCSSPAVDFGPDDGLRKISIAEVVDIEEMAWAPKYGLKGVIDASVRVCFEPESKVPNEKIMPLEFKTGKGNSGQSAMEHSAQVILYTLLMSDRYSENVDSGLLYYLHADQTVGTPVRRSDLIGLIMRRNQLAHDILKASLFQQLPPMLQSPDFCRRCRHLNACTIYHKVHGGSAGSSGLGNFFDSLTNHLSASHNTFFKQWDRLIDLEAKETRFSQHKTWRSLVSKSALSSSCLRSIVLDAADQIQIQNPARDNQFIYRFVHKDELTLDVRLHHGNFKNVPFSAEADLDCTLRNGDHVILSSESSHFAVARGIIREISRSHVSISFSKRLRLPRSPKSSLAQDLYNEVWRIDKDEVSSTFTIMRFNLVQLFLQIGQSAQLRKLIVDLEAPRYDSGSILSQDPAISYIWSERNLNDDQRRAIIKIITAKDYALILGMPGTGKTSTMVYAVKALLIRGRSILLTSYTNSAVDNVLIKLKTQGIDFLRIGRCDVVHQEVRGHCISDMDIHSVNEIRMKMDQVKVVGVTCLGVTSPLLANKKFDVCIMDEAGQTSLPVSLGPLLFASTFVLVGDHYQLPPLVQSAEARESGMSVSLFRRLSEAHPQAISALQSQYRMCEGIMKLSNALIYGDRLRCGSSDVENAKLKLQDLGSSSPWLRKVLAVEKPVILINTDMLPAFEVRDNKTVNNPVEAYIVAEVIESLVNHGVEKEVIGVITPYNSQANLIQQAVNMAGLEVHTIDKYQGRDKDCILVSFVRSSQNPKNCSSSLLGDWHRINVALTRAKKKLIMVGSSRTLSKVPLLKLLVEKVDEQSGIFSITKDDINHIQPLKRCSQLR